MFMYVRKCMHDIFEYAYILIELSSKLSLASLNSLITTACPNF